MNTQSWKYDKLLFKWRIVEIKEFNDFKRKGNTLPYLNTYYKKEYPSFYIYIYGKELITYWVILENYIAMILLVYLPNFFFFLNKKNFDNGEF